MMVAGVLDTILSGVLAVAYTVVGLYMLYNVAAIVGALASAFAGYEVGYVPTVSRGGTVRTEKRPLEANLTFNKPDGIWTAHVHAWTYILATIALLIGTAAFFYAVGFLRAVIKGAL